MSLFIAPPRRLSIWASHPDYHPSYPRVGIVFDGAERNDVQWYDLDQQVIRLNVSNKLLSGKVEAFWRYGETRQQRRAREAWERKKGYVRDDVGASGSGNQIGSGKEIK